MENAGFLLVLQLTYPKPLKSFGVGVSQISSALRQEWLESRDSKHENSRSISENCRELGLEVRLKP